MKFYWFLNSKSQKLILARFLIRPILDPKFPLMMMTMTMMMNNYGDDEEEDDYDDDDEDEGDV